MFVWFVLMLDEGAAKLNRVVLKGMEKNLIFLRYVRWRILRKKRGVGKHIHDQELRFDFECISPDSN